MIIRPYQNADLESVRRLFDLRRLPFDGDLFRWKKKCPGQISFVAQIEGTTIGHGCVLPMPLPFGTADEAPFGFLVDGIFHPDHAHINLIAEVFSHAADDSRKIGAQGLLAFPNARMATAMTFLGWREAARFEWISSQGTTAAPRSPMVPPGVRSAAYEMWRWQQVPRCIWMCSDGDSLALFADMKSIGVVLLWINRFSILPAFAAKYSFFCLKGKNVPMPESFRLTSSAAAPILLHRSFTSPGEVPAVPSLWYAEALEAVTLGW